MTIILSRVIKNNKISKKNDELDNAGSAFIKKLILYKCQCYKHCDNKRYIYNRFKEGSEK